MAYCSKEDARYGFEQLRKYIGCELHRISIDCEGYICLHLYRNGNQVAEVWLQGDPEGNGPAFANVIQAELPDYDLV